MVESGYPQLIVLRHAKAERTAARDRDRRLTERGRADARAAGRWLREHDLVPDLVLVSAAVRARETAELAVAELPGRPEIRVLEELYEADVNDVLDELRGLLPEVHRVMVVGHNPTLEEAATALVGLEHGPVHLSTSAFVVLQTASWWADLEEGTAELVAASEPPHT